MAGDLRKRLKYRRGISKFISNYTGILKKGYQAAVRTLDNALRKQLNGAKKYQARKVINQKEDSIKGGEPAPYVKTTTAESFF